MGDRAYLTKQVSISAQHELKSPALSEEENRRNFGKCFRLHGHDYKIEVTVEGFIDKDSGLICDRDFFDNILEKEVVSRFDKTNLNDFFPSTTGEALAKEFYQLLVEKLKPLKLVQVGVHETPKNFFTHGVSSEVFRF